MRRIAKATWRLAATLLLLTLAAAWPASYLPWSLAVGARDGRRGPRLEFGDNAGSVPGWREKGWTFCLDRDAVILLLYKPVANPGPLVPHPDSSEVGDTDSSRWYGSTNSHGIGAGTILIGDRDSPFWEARTGVLVPAWPISIAAVLALCVLLRRWRPCRRTADANACLRCFYDLRAHKPGDKCPECGTSIAAAIMQGIA